MTCKPIICPSGHGNLCQPYAGQKATGKSRGFAFVEFGDSEGAQRAIDQFHNKEFQGRQLTVNIAHPRKERPPRWRGGDRGDRTEQR